MTTLLVKQRKYLHLVTNHARKNRAMNYEQGRWFSSLLRTTTFAMFISIEYSVFVGFHWKQFLLKEASLQLFTML